MKKQSKKKVGKTLVKQIQKMTKARNKPINETVSLARKRGRPHKEALSVVPKVVTILDEGKAPREVSISELESTFPPDKEYINGQIQSPTKNSDSSMKCDISDPSPILHYESPGVSDAIAMLTIPSVVNYVGANKEIKQLPDNVLRFVNQWFAEREKEKKHE